MDNWEELKSAYSVGIHGTVTAAADVLGVHRATVIRHVNALEARIGQKLFIRHTNGYKPTDAGEELIKIVKVSDEQFKGLSARLANKKESIRGELIITSVDAFAPLLLPAVDAFHSAYPETRSVFISTARVLRLQYGEAHIALRPGKNLSDEDTHAIFFGDVQFGLYATNEYLRRHGKPESVDDLKQHRFISRYDTYLSSFERWIQQNIPTENVVLQGTSPFVFYQSILNHIGMGFLASFVKPNHPNLVEIMPPREDWNLSLWIIVHKDLYKTEKVAAFLSVLEKTNPLKS
ncbi:MAG: LysR family transcriptional regulator [Pseudomonadota bacterium]